MTTLPVSTACLLLIYSLHYIFSNVNNSYPAFDLFFSTLLIIMIHVWQIWKEWVHNGNYVILPLSCLLNLRSASSQCLNDVFSASLKSQHGRESQWGASLEQLFRRSRNIAGVNDNNFCTHQVPGALFHNAVYASLFCSVPSCLCRS